MVLDTFYNNYLLSKQCLLSRAKKTGPWSKRIPKRTTTMHRNIGKNKKKEFRKQKAIIHFHVCCLCTHDWILNKSSYYHCQWHFAAFPSMLLVASEISHSNEKKTINQQQIFIEGKQEIKNTMQRKEVGYTWITGTLELQTVPNPSVATLLLFFFSHLLRNGCFSVVSGKKKRTLPPQENRPY